MKKGLVTLVVVLCILCAVLLCGCGSVTYRTMVGEAGSRIIDIVVERDDMSAKEWEFCQTYMQAYYERLVAAGRDAEFLVDQNMMTMRQVYASATDYYLAMGYTGDEPSEPLEGEVVGLLMKEYAVEMTIIDRQTLISYALDYWLMQEKISADSVKEYANSLRAWWKSMRTESDPDLKAIVLQVWTSPSVFAATAEVLPQLPESYLEGMATGLRLDEVDFTYQYSHVYESVEAREYDNAYVDEFTGQTVYVWNMKLDDAPTASVVLYQTSPNVWVWEVLALVAGLVVAGALALVVLCKRRKVEHGRRQKEEN